MTKAPDLSMFTKEEIRSSLDAVRHPVSVAVFGSNYFNNAAIIRTAHQFLVKEIILVDCPKFYKKATMGTHKWENITHLTLENFLCRFSLIPNSSDDRSIVVFERRLGLESEDLMFYSYPKNPILCFGNEKTGVPEEIINLAKIHSSQNGKNNIVSIPQYGLHNDLNLANAASIVLYDWIFKWYTSYGKK